MAEPGGGDSHGRMDLPTTEFERRKVDFRLTLRRHARMAGSRDQAHRRCDEGVTRSWCRTHEVRSVADRKGVTRCDGFLGPGAKPDRLLMEGDAALNRAGHQGLV